MPIHIPTDSSSTCVHARNIRSCEINIPYACTRIVALTLVCDGQVQRSELGTLDELRGFEQLGLTDAEFQAVVFDLCADLLVTAKAEGDDARRIEPMMIEQWMSEVHDAELRRTVLRLRGAVIDADGYVIESESMWMLAAIEHWGIRPGGLEALIHCSARSTSYCPGAGVSRFPIDRIMLACEGESV